jgi:hypothetical protein
MAYIRLNWKVVLISKILSAVLFIIEVLGRHNFQTEIPTNKQNKTKLWILEVFLKSNFKIIALVFFLLFLLLLLKNWRLHLYKTWNWD